MEAKPPGGPGSAAAQPVASGSAGNKPAAPPTAVSAAASAPLFGGNRGGKKRLDGLAPGSPEAIEADRKKDAERKRTRREAVQRVAEPPPLPSAGAPAPGANLAPGSGQSPDAGDSG